MLDVLARRRVHDRSAVRADEVRLEVRLASVAHNRVVPVDAARVGLPILNGVEHLPLPRPWPEGERVIIAILAVGHPL
eukprot:5408713-Prymnesium_polylepis.1